ncbi:Tensin-2 (C1 domain-containing phosphatase and tensin homolog) (C1-TEN) (Tensin-like C1 domain-containing phosphatase) [Durusdinium trenchii]|uniref:Tensin-2 (C1 domain-containing phosphatase and tensin homolog) (C1-TEN) (Tensin-like C1 domain-containing phosphatase) n=1 Tax=Durusdinium trenchii TaxID=1381693 RepID=A0ABP0HUK3_9DINO
MYTGGKDCAVIRWDIETGKKDIFPGGRNRFECGGHFEKVLSVCLLEQRGLLVSAGVDRVVAAKEAAEAIQKELLAESLEPLKLAARLNRDHSGSYLVINLSGTSYDTYELQGPCMDIMMSGCVLPLEVLLRLVVSVQQWLSRAARNVVVVHGADDGSGTAANYGPGSFPVVLFFACYLSWVGKADHPKEAMVEVTRRMGISRSLWPSQLRYLSYFELLQRGKLDLWSHPARLARVVLVHAGSHLRDRALEVWKQEQLIFRTNVSEDDDVCHTSAFRITSPAEGDLSLRLVSRRAQEDDGAVGDWELELQVCFHTALIALAGGFTRFPSSEIDSACEQSCTVDVFVELLNTGQDEGDSSASAAMILAAEQSLGSQRKNCGVL